MSKASFLPCKMCNTTDERRMSQGRLGFCSRCYRVDKMSRTKCQADNCEKPAVGRYCNRHLRNLRLYSCFEPVRFSRLNYCKEVGCYQNAHSYGRCQKHHQRTKDNRPLREVTINCEMCQESVTVGMSGVVPRFCRDCRTYADHIKRNYDLDVEGYLSLGQLQEWSCAICGAHQGGPLTKDRRLLVVDHDHDSGQVRGLLCSSCNVGLGLFQEDLVVLVTATVYLQRNGKSLTPYAPAE
jgi:hypothetical protein